MTYFGIMAGIFLFAAAVFPKHFGEWIAEVQFGFQHAPRQKWEKKMRAERK